MMSNDYLKKAAVTSIALSLLLSASLAFQSSHTAYADGEINQHSKDQRNQLSNRLKRMKEHKAIPIFEEAAKVIGISTEELIKQVQQGKSIVEVAKSKGISEKKLSSKLMAMRVEKLNEAVKSGKITKENAAKIKEKMSEHLKFMLNRKGLPESHFAKHKQHMLLNQEQIAAMLGITREELVNQLKAGRSLSEIAQEKGISRDQLIQKMKDQLTPFIEKRIDMKFKKEE